MSFEEHLENFDERIALCQSDIISLFRVKELIAVEHVKQIIEQEIRHQRNKFELLVSLKEKADADKK